MNNTIVVKYDERTKRLVMTCSFHMNDAIRSFPSRRFDPKSKTWRAPLVKANIRQLRDMQAKCHFDISPEADHAIENYESLLAAPKMVPFPRHTYDFTKAATAYEPMEHQHRMLDHAWGLNAAAYFARMGTGKTYVAIHLASARFKAGQIDAVMVICPSTLRPTWRKEFAKFATVDYDFREHSTKAPWLRDFYRPRKDVNKEPMQVLAVSVEGLGVSEALYDSVCGFMPGRRVMVICDESSRIKNPDAKRTKRTIDIGSAAEYRIILNGTPIALGIQDLWSQYEFLDPNIIGTGDYWAFKTRYVTMGGYEGKQIIGYQNVDELMNLIIPYTIEIGKEVLNLPPKVKKPLYCEPSIEQKKLFRLIVKGSTGEPNAPTIKVDNSLEKLLRLRQVVGGYLPRTTYKSTVIDGETHQVAHTVIEPLAENPKMDLLFDAIEDNYLGSKFIIWTTFIHEIEHIATELKKKYGAEAVECYYGSTGMDERSTIEDRYCNDPKLRFFIGNPVAAGLGLTLISGENDVMVYYSGTHAFIDRAQSEDRSHRIGQKNTVVVVDLVMEKTVDELIQASIEAKMDIETYVMERVKAGIKLDDLVLGI